MDKNKLDLISLLLKKGYSVKEISNFLNLSKSTVYKYRKIYLDSISDEEEYKRNKSEYKTKQQLFYYLKDKSKLDDCWNKELEKRYKERILLNLKGFNNSNLWFCKTDKINFLCKKIDDKCMYDLKYILEQTIDDDKRDILEQTFGLESYFSSLIEGAYSTKKDAEKIIKKERTPKNDSEKMIYNNHMALEYGLYGTDKLNSNKFILELHDKINKDCLDKGSDIYEYRVGEVYVKNSRGEVVHEGAPVNQLDELMEKLFNFIDEEDNLSPLIKSAIMHFYFVYVHPFDDGNGRTARALSYIYLIKNGYEMFKHFSISYIINKYKIQYYKTIKNCEDYDLDITYFIEFILVICLISVEEMILKFERMYIKSSIENDIQSKYLILSEQEMHILDFIIKQDDFSISVKRYINKCRNRFLRENINDEDVEETINNLFITLEEKGVLCIDNNTNEDVVYKINPIYEMIY